MALSDPASNPYLNLMNQRPNVAAAGGTWTLGPHQGTGGPTHHTVFPSGFHGPGDEFPHPGPGGTVPVSPSPVGGHPFQPGGIMGSWFQNALSGWQAQHPDWFQHLQALWQQHPGYGGGAANPILAYLRGYAGQAAQGTTSVGG